MNVLLFQIDFTQRRSSLSNSISNEEITAFLQSLSAHLAEITGNSTYTNAAIASANWIKNLNLGTNNIVLDTVNANTCARSPSNWLFTYNSGKYVEGLSILAAVTGDNQWRTL